MENELVLAAFLVGAVVLGSGFGWIAFFQLQFWKKQSRQLGEQLSTLQAQVLSINAGAHRASLEDSTHTDTTNSNAPPIFETSNPDTHPQPPPSVDRDATAHHAPSTDNQASPSQWLQHLKGNWMVWLGGTSVGLSGVFLVKYSIDAGLLGPIARITLALLCGISFHGSAFWLRKKTAQHSDAFAALAGGASIILYAALLAALHLYQLWPSSLVFAMLLIVSLATMSLALLYGPVLAGIGILGAYLVPILVNTGSDNMLGALTYATVISLSALWLMRSVYRTWLWVGTLTGALGWWLLSFNSELPSGLRLLYIFTLSYGLVAVHKWDWLLNKKETITKNYRLLTGLKRDGDKRNTPIIVAYIVILLAQFISLSQERLQLPLLASALLLPLFMLWLARLKPVFSLLAWPSFIASSLGLLFAALDLDSTVQVSLLNGAEQRVLAIILAAIAGVYFFAGLWNMRSSHLKGYWASLAFLSPVLTLAVAYIALASMRIHWEWAAVALALGATYMLALNKLQNSVTSHQQMPALPPAFIAAVVIAAHLAYSLAVAMFLREATLTLALAVQVVTLVRLEKHYALAPLSYAVKAVLSIVILRLSLNPWLLSYPVDSHWSLWVCGGAFVATTVASQLASNRMNLPQWLQGAALHLLALTCIFETRYQLYEGNIFQQSYSFTEAAINTGVWGLLGVVYLYRSQLAGTLQKFYKRCAYPLLCGAAANYILSLVLAYNPLWTDTNISTTPLFNILLLAYGLPVVICLACYSLIAKPWKKSIGLLGAFALLYFASIEIRHLWHGTLDIHQPSSDGEHYTYSMVWLLFAVIGTVLGIRFQRQLLYKGAMLLLMAVVAKIFIFDMAGLTSLWRVGSFMGLGLCLLGLAYFHQQIRETYSRTEYS